ncbi:hypothetical protein B0H16DRAFT_1716581 [Mycena metata]|uniref:Uncharacterized protein n=1 Tax=Mycena metata TaxID=1033252 RepID=A0AAD7JPE7_9AGAR|nr:hypothetical protein B0H16DRAFT_1716581 [Mycena metata]
MRVLAALVGSRTDVRADVGESSYCAQKGDTKISKWVCTTLDVLWNIDTDSLVYLVRLYSPTFTLITPPCSPLWLLLRHHLHPPRAQPPYEMQAGYHQRSAKRVRPPIAKTLPPGPNTRAVDLFRAIERRGKICPSFEGCVSRLSRKTSARRISVVPQREDVDSLSALCTRAGIIMYPSRPPRLMLTVGLPSIPTAVPGVPPLSILTSACTPSSSTNR